MQKSAESTSVPATRALLLETARHLAITSTSKVFDYIKDAVDISARMYLT